VPKSILGAWRAVSGLIQSDISTSQPVNSLLYFDGEPLETEIDQRYVNSDEITGEVLPTMTRTLTKKFAAKHKGKATPHLVALFASMAMGKCTTAMVAATTAYRHKLEIEKNLSELPKRTVVEWDGDVQRKFVGVACSGFTISGKRGGLIEFEAELIGKGGEATDATAKPARVAESYLSYADTKLLRGGTFDGTAVTGGTDLSSPLLDFKLTFKNGAKGVSVFGDSSGESASIRRGLKVECDLEASFEVEDASHRNALLNGTEYVLDIPVVGGTANGSAKYTIDIVLPRIQYREAKKGQEEGTLKVAGKFDVLSDPSYGGLIINCINLQTTSYLLTA
jgi:hypothetical protein